MNFESYNKIFINISSHEIIDEKHIKCHLSLKTFKKLMLYYTLSEFVI